MSPLLQLLRRSLPSALLLLSCLAALADSIPIPVAVRQNTSPAVIINQGTPQPTPPAPQSAVSPPPTQVPTPGQPPIIPNVPLSPPPSPVVPPSIAPAAPADTGNTNDPDTSGTVGVSSPSPSPVPPVGSGGLNGGAITGIVIGVLLLLALIALLIWLVAKRSSDDDNNNINNTNNTTTPATGGAGAAYATPEAGTRSLAGAGAAAGGAAAGGAAGAPKGGDGSIQDVNLAAEAEADTSGGVVGDGYVVSDSARHHGAAAAGAVVAAAAGAGAAGAIVASSPREALGTTERAPSPPPHDYVVGVGKIETKSDFEDIKTRFARDEIEDKSAVLGGTTHTIADTPLGEGNTNENTPDNNNAKNNNVADPSPLVSDVKNPVADLSEDRSGDVSEAARGLAVPELIIAEEAAETPLFERDELPK